MASVHNLIVKRGEAEILKNFSAEFPEHQVTAVSGRSGCGKTTLLSVLLNLLPADSGEIHGFQKPSAVFQEDRLLPYLTAAKNISVAAGCTETAAEKALLQVGFDPEDLKKNAVQLSGGMARRVSIVRAMLTSGDAVLLDEPFKGLDDLTREKVMQFVKENLKNRTTILVTHDPRDANDLRTVVNHRAATLKVFDPTFFQKVGRFPQKANFFACIKIRKGEQTVQWTVCSWKTLLRGVRWICIANP